MTTIPDAAIEAAAKELNVLGLVAPGWMPVGVARVAIEAAMPAIREALAQEIEAQDENVLEREVHIYRGDIAWVRDRLASVVRGGTP